MNIDLRAVEDAAKELYIRALKLLPPDIKDGFARLRYRDGKQGYLEMIPRFYRYLLDVLPRYPEFHAMQRVLERAECVP